MSTTPPEPIAPDDVPMDPAVGKWVFLGMIVFMAVATVAFFAARPRTPPPPAELLNDPLLVEGRSIFLSRCFTCHGLEGKGDGPMVAGLGGEKVGDLTDGVWKHGGKADEVLRVVAKGVPGSRMTGWSELLEERQVRAAAAYCYFLSKQPVPPELRTAAADAPR